MTENARRRGVGAEGGGLRAILLLLLMLLLSLVLSDEIAELVKEGLKTAICFVVPSAFPFMILCDLYTAYGYPERIRPLGWFMERVMKISQSGTRAYVLGGLSGFPIGARATAELYRSREICKSEANRLLALSTTPSPAFVLGAVGHGMLKSERGGPLLLGALIMSQLILGVTLGAFGSKNDNSPVISKQKFDFIASVRSAGISCVAISAFVAFFRCAVGVLSILIPYPVFTSVITTLAEVTGAVSSFASATYFSTPLKYGLISFSLGFGGLSVLMQSAIFLKDTDLSVGRFFLLKLLNGLIAFCVGGGLALVFGV